MQVDVFPYALIARPLPALKEIGLWTLTTETPHA